ncbi:AraC family transcriptional regulator [Microbulbifer hainanensis]|uniref:AraC family transcriptional regulator n=1 Tax=Microbulbifer hainanensis TaxID=2735675 RepID=UPI001D02F377|nr:AraC family transcriptional regulator [Microbulbifer hainanensis]
MTLLIRTASLTGFYELVTRLNGNPDALLHRFNIDPEKVLKLEGVMPYRTKIALIEEAARALNCPDFGLRLAQEQDLTMFGSLAAIALSAPTVGEAMQKIVQYMRYYAPGMHMTLDRGNQGGLAYLKLEVSEPITGARQHMELALGLANNVFKMLYGSDFRAEAVTLKASESLGHNSYQQIFEAPVYFGRESDALVVSTEHLNKNIDAQNPALYELFGKYINDALICEPLDVLHQVKQLIYRLLPTQRCNLQVVANQLGLHKRTLQRRLSEHGIVFEDLLDDIRRERADSYLSEPEMPMTQIASLLGYREQSSFNRACRRWYGITPLSRRSKLQTTAMIKDASAILEPAAD